MYRYTPSLLFKEIAFIFQWLIKTSSHFQVTVMHSMQAGYLEKAQKYTDKALMQLEKLKSERQSSDYPDFTVFTMYYGARASWNFFKFPHADTPYPHVTLADAPYPLCSCYPR